MPDRQCASCDRKAEWGCTAVKLREPEPNEDERDCWENPAFMPVTIDGIDSYACPRQHLYLYPDFWRVLMKYYAMYRQGFLPEAGAVIDQSNFLVEAFAVIDQVNDECDAEERKANDPGNKGDPSNRGKR